MRDFLIVEDHQEAADRSPYFDLNDGSMTGARVQFGHPESVDFRFRIVALQNFIKAAV